VAEAGSLGVYATHWRNYEALKKSKIWEEEDLSGSKDEGGHRKLRAKTDTKRKKIDSLGKRQSLPRLGDPREGRGGFIYGRKRGRGEAEEAESQTRGLQKEKIRGLSKTGVR